MSAAGGIWAAVPVKDTRQAKQRLAGLLPPELRRPLALAMLEDVLAALAAAPGLAGILVVTEDVDARALAERFGAGTVAEDANAGHTAAVAAAARRLVKEGRAGMLAVPGNVPLATAAEVERFLAAHGPAPAFTIAPAHDERGSNAVLVSPPDAVPLSFGNDSFWPHLRAAEVRGIRPAVVRLAGFGLDIDGPEDLAAFAAIGRHTKALACLESFGIARTLRASRAGATAGRD